MNPDRLFELLGPGLLGMGVAIVLLAWAGIIPPEIAVFLGGAGVGGGLAAIVIAWGPVR